MWIYVYGSIEQLILCLNFPSYYVYVNILKFERISETLLVSNISDKNIHRVSVDDSPSLCKI